MQKKVPETRMIEDDDAMSSREVEKEKLEVENDKQPRRTKDSSKWSRRAATSSESDTT